MAFSELCKELLKEPAREPRFDEKAVDTLKNAVELASSLNDPIKVLSLSITIITGELTTDQKVDRLIGRHYAEGMRYLKDAQSAQEELNEKRRKGRWQEVQRSQDELRNIIRNALRAFQATATIANPLDAAKADFFVGECYDFLNERKTALDHYTNAYVNGQKEILKKLTVYLPIQHMTLYRREAYEKYEKIRFRMRFMIPLDLSKYTLGQVSGTYAGARGRQICILTEELMNQYLSYAMSAYMLTRIPDKYPVILPSFLLPKEEVEQINNELTMDLLDNSEKHAKNLEVFIKAFLSKPFAPIPTNRFIASVYNLPPMREMSQYEAEFLKPLSALLSRRK